MSTQIPGRLTPAEQDRDLFSAPAPRATAPNPAGALRRKLHAGHFAFMRAVVQGVELQVAWDRYLRWEEEGGDARAMRATIAWLRDEFAAAARREARFGTARLVLLDAARVPDPAGALPSLEDFVDRQGLEDFPQAEQIALYEAEYGRASQRQRRRARLIARQLEALGWIEQQVAQPPRAEDSVGYWLNPLLAEPLRRGGLQTLGDLQADIDGRGPHWYRRLQGIGETKAARVEAWIDAHRLTLGSAQSTAQSPARSSPKPPAQPGWAANRAASPSPLPPVSPASPGARALTAAESAAVHATHPTVAPTAVRPFAAGAAPTASVAAAASPGAAAAPAPAHPARHPGPATPAVVPPAVVPLDRFACPAALDGRYGRNRRPAADVRLPIDDDRSAIAAWLAAPSALSQGAGGRSPHTRRAYQREAERLLLWSVVERGKALSSLDAGDCMAYRRFLADPQPRARWCVRPSPGRQSPLWRPFTGPLGAAGQRQAAAALSSLFGFLVDQRYLWANPWRERPSFRSGLDLDGSADAAAPGAPMSSPAGLHAKGAAVPGAIPSSAHAAVQASGPVQGVAASSSSASASAVPALRRTSGSSPGRPLDASRSLSPALWASVLDAADALPDEGACPRLRFALRWLYATGLRLSEAVGARLGDLRQEPLPPVQSTQPAATEPAASGEPAHASRADPAQPDPARSDHVQFDHAPRPAPSDQPARPAPPPAPPCAWWLRVPPDASGRARELPLPDSLIDALRDYLRRRGLDADPLAAAQREAFVLGHATERGERARRLPQRAPFDAQQGVRASTLARQLKQHFGRCAAARAAQGDAEGARQLAAASAHWLRHTHARHLLANGLPLALAQQHLGHAARSTTAAYLVDERSSTRGDWQAAWDATMAAQRGHAPYPGAKADPFTDDLPDR